MQSFSKPITQPAESSHRTSHFALFIEEKLNSFDKRTRMIPEKKISDLIFEIEMPLDSGREEQNIIPLVNVLLPRPTPCAQYGNVNLQNRLWSNTP